MTQDAPIFSSVADVSERLRSQGYIASPQIATSVLLAERLHKPLLIEGPAGCGKTELAKVLSQTLGTDLFRLQCYEGLDEAKALYEWAYPKQLLYTQILRDKIGDLLSGVGSLADAVATTRDRCRSPFQWEPGPNAGFSPAGVTTWLPVHANHARGVNVADQEPDPASLLIFYRRLLRVRRASPALSGGEYEVIDTGHDVLAFWRRSADPAQTCVVALNFSATTQTLEIGSGEGQTLFRLDGSDGASIDPRSITLTPFDVLVVEIRASA